VTGEFKCQILEQTDYTVQVTNPVAECLESSSGKSCSGVHETNAGAEWLWRVQETNAGVSDYGEFKWQILLQSSRDKCWCWVIGEFKCEILEESDWRVQVTNPVAECLESSSDKSCCRVQETNAGAEWLESSSDKCCAYTTAVVRPGFPLPGCRIHYGIPSNYADKKGWKGGGGAHLCFVPLTLHILPGQPHTHRSIAWLCMSVHHHAPAVLTAGLFWEFWWKATIAQYYSAFLQINCDKKDNNCNTTSRFFPFVILKETTDGNKPVCHF